MTAAPRVIYTRALCWAQAMAVTSTLIIMRPERRGDEALLAHERCHCGQMRRDGTVVFWWRYATSRAFRQAVEVEAYRVQLAMRPAALEAFATSLATRYYLPLTVAQARALLTA